MRDLAPDITRKRLLIEGFYAIDVDADKVQAYLMGISSHLGLRTYGPPTIHAPQGMGSTENQGFDAFVPLIDSGISLYVWTHRRFFSAVLYTCKEFDSDRAVGFTRDFFAAVDIESEAF